MLILFYIFTLNKFANWNKEHKEKLHAMVGKFYYAGTQKAHLIVYADLWILGHFDIDNTLGH